MSLPATVSIGSEVMSRQVADETVLLHLPSGTYFGLDAVGSRVWELLVAGKAPAEIVEQLVGEYDVPAHTLEADLTRLLSEMAERGLLKLA